MARDDGHRPHDKRRYDEGFEHTFGDGPPPTKGDDSVHWSLNGVDQGLWPPPGEAPIMAEPKVFPGEVPQVTIKYACGQQHFDGVEMRCGMMVAPAQREDSKGMIVYLSGTPSEILHMVLAAIDSAEAFGLKDALKLCIERGVGMGDVREVLGEEWWGG